MIRTFCLILLSQLLAGGLTHAVELVGGTEIPDRYVVRNHREARYLMPINQVLWRLGWAKLTTQCHFLDDRLQPTKTTLAGAAAVSLNVFPESLIDRRANVGKLLRAHGTMQLVSDWFAEYALSISNSELEKATEIVRNAERHDAYCVERLLAEVRARQRALQEGLVISYAARDGAAVVWKPQAPAEKVRLGETESLERHLSNARDTAAEYARGYELVYAKLRQREQGLPSRQAAPTISSRPPTPITVPSSSPLNTAVETIRTEQQQVVETIRRLKEHCLHDSRC